MTARMLFLTGLTMSLAAACSPRPESRESTPPAAVDTATVKLDTMRADTTRRDTAMAPSSQPAR